MDIRSPGNDPIPDWYKAYEAKFGKDPDPSVMQDWKDMWNALQSLANSTNSFDAGAFYNAFEKAYSKLLNDLKASGFTPDKPGYQDVMNALANLNNGVKSLYFAGEFDQWGGGGGPTIFKNFIEPALVNILSLIEKYTPPSR